MAEPPDTRRANTCPPSCPATPPPSIVTAAGRTTRPTAPSGIRRTPPRIARPCLRRPLGATRRTTAGRGSRAATCGPAPPRHYGRWNLGARGWHWIPSRRWGAAWVCWAVASDYVGWCPLGWNGRPVLGVFAYDRTYTSRWRDPYRAWTVIPRTSSGRSAVASRVRRPRPPRSRAPGVHPAAPRPGHRPAAVAVSVARQRRAERPPRHPIAGPPAAASRRRARAATGAYGSDRDSRGGYAVPRGTASEENTPSESPYRARPSLHAAPRPAGR